MSEASLKSLATYSRFVSQVLNRPDVERSNRSGLV